ncbi:MAG: beta-ketoacyl-ACP synthase II [Chloroflexi bacterium]|nr:beta-ketoacyl-ACP synthase II [Chloroflexota bacterium]
MNNHNRRVVVTGLGAVTPLGLSMEETWQGLIAGRSGVGPVTAFDAAPIPPKIAGEVKGFDPQNYMDFKESKRTARMTQLAIAAAKEALAHARLDMSREDPTRVGTEIGTAVGGLENVISEQKTLETRGARRINPLAVPSLLINMPSCQIAMMTGAKGPAHSPVAACATGIYAVGDAARRIAFGDADVVVAGGTESLILPVVLAAFDRLQALSGRNDAPAEACRPFSLDRDGTVIGEGAAVLILETLEHALKRGAQILAEVVGYGVSEDAYHVVAPDPTGDGAARAMAGAIRDAGLALNEVDYVSAHGTGTPLNDLSETLAIKRVFGEQAYNIAISSIKSMIGHTFGAAGAIAVAANVRAILDGIVPPTINLHKPDPQCDLDYVPNRARQMDVRVAMANAFGFGGQNGSLIVKRFEG